MLGPFSIASMELGSVDSASRSATVENKSECFGPRPPARKVSFATNEGTVSSCKGCLSYSLATMLRFSKISSNLPA